MPQQNMFFLEQRIYEIGSALMHCFDDNSNRLPTSIINVLKIDKGNVYAIIQQHECRFFDRNTRFATELKFYRKGKPFYIDVAGEVTFIENVDQLNTLMGWSNEDCLQNRENAVLIKVKINNIDYYEWKKAEGVTGFWKHLYKWMVAINPVSLSRRVRPLASFARRYAHL